MSNEELVKLIQEGQQEHISTLWSQVEAFISLMAYKKLNALPENLWYLRDDMVNEAYFYFLKAIDGYKDEQGGKFLTYLTYHLKNCFNKVIYGGVTEKAMREPLNTAVSLNQPINDDDSITLTDSLIDVNSEAYYRNIEDVDYWEEMNRILQQGINHIYGKPQEILQTMLNNNVDLSGARKLMGGSIEQRQNYRQLYQKGLRELRRYLTMYIGKRENKGSGIHDYVSYCYGFGRFYHTHTSAVEWAVLKNERDLKYADMLHCINRG
nr:hypothetical protein [uncultured Aminipila sp.]